MFKQLECKRCHCRLPEDLFPEQGSKLETYMFLKQYRKRTCIFCAQDIRDEKKKANRFLYKARTTLSHHAKSLGISAKRLAKTFGWDTYRIAKDFELAYAGNCSICGHPYKQESNGFHNMTLDIIEREKSPDYGINTRICCLTCNTNKANLSNADFAYRQRWRKERERFLHGELKDLTTEQQIKLDFEGRA